MGDSGGIEFPAHGGNDRHRVEEVGRNENRDRREGTVVRERGSPVYGGWIEKIVHAHGREAPGPE